MTNTARQAKADDDNNQPTSIVSAPDPHKGLPLSRRGFVAGALGVGVAVVAASSEAFLAGCSPAQDNASEPLISQATQDKDIPVVQVSPDQVIEGTQFDEASFDDYLVQVASYDLPVGALAYQMDINLALVLLPAQDVGCLRQIALLSLADGTTTVLVSAPVGVGRNKVIYDARASKSQLIWVEVDLGDLSWQTYVVPLTWSGSQVDSDIGANAVLVEQGTADYEPPMLAVAVDKAYWTVMPLATGSASQQDSLLRAVSGKVAAGSVHVAGSSQDTGSGQGVDNGQGVPYTILTSHGRMITNPLVSSNVITVVPRVDTGNVYYQLTALDCDKDSSVAFQVLPQSLKVSDAVYLKDGFAFSIEDNYDYAGGLANSGIYQQLADGNYLHVSKPPTNAMVQCGDSLLVKSTNSIIGIDAANKKLFIISPPELCSDFGEALIGGGALERFATCSVRMQPAGGDAEATVIRVFGQKAAAAAGATGATGAAGAAGAAGATGATGSAGAQNGSG